MVTEEKIKELAFSFWEKEGHPEGKDKAHYFRAKQILETQGAAPVQIALKPPIIELSSMSMRKRRR